MCVYVCVCLNIQLEEKIIWTYVVNSKYVTAIISYIFPFYSTLEVL